MRRGELLSLRWEYVDLQARFACLPDTKNGDARTVPWSSAAVEVSTKLPRHTNGLVFPVKAFTLDAAFKRGLARAGPDDLRFHDLRRTRPYPRTVESSALIGNVDDELSGEPLQTPFELIMIF